MFVYLDESGDTGFRFRQGSSTHFVIALVMIDDPIPIHEAIDQLRSDLGLSKEKEFKFSQMRDHTKENFFRAVRPFPFQVRCLIVDKTRLTSPNLRDKMTFYNFLVRMVLQNDFGTIRNATLVIDESVQDKKKQAHFASYLRAQLNPVDQKQERRIKEVRFHKSHIDNLIQLADMVAGAVARAYISGDTSFLEMIQRRIQDTWEFPPT